MIELKNVVKSFSDKTILNNISLTVKSGEICGLVGLNGIGKTTLIRTIAGLLPIDSGTITVDNYNPYTSNGIKKNIGAVLDSDGFSGNLSFIDNLSFFAKIKSINKENLFNYIQKYWSHLLEKHVPIKEFSKGERMQCALARAFLGSPKIVLLDEPTVNLDQMGLDKLISLIREFSHKGGATIISSHALHIVSDISTTIAHLSSNGLVKQDNDNESLCLEIECDNIDKCFTLLENKAYQISKKKSSLLIDIVAKEDIPQIISLLVRNNIKIYELKRVMSFDFTKEEL